MWIVRLALRRPYTFVVMALLIAILGCLSIFRTPTDIFPDINIPVISVIWNYTGISPDEMEQRIVSNYERALTTTVNDIEHIESQSLYGVSVTKIFFQPGAKIQEATAQVTAISQTLLRQLPTGTTPPLVIRYSASNQPVVELGLGSDTLSEQQIGDLAMNFLRSGLSNVPGAQVPYPYGGKQRQIMVDIDPNKLYAWNLSPQDVSNAVNAQNLILPAGTAKIGSNEYNVRVNSSPQTVDAFNNIPIKTINGTTVYIRDVAHVRDGFSPQTNMVHVDGKRAALLPVLKSGGASTLDVVNQVKAKLPNVLATLPKEFKVNYLFDQSVFVRAAISGVVREAVIAAVLTGLMILLFLGSWRSTLIVVTSIPLSILTSLVILSALGETINTMTLGGLALAVGILVDDATVEIENIHRNLVMKKPLVQAILDGAQQIAVPAFVSTLCICIVFIPVAFITGAAKYLFTPLAEAVVFAMLMSYVLSRTLVPTMVNFLLGAEVGIYAGQGDAPRGVIWRVHDAFNRVFERMRSVYAGFLAWALGHRALVAAGFLLFVGGSCALFPFLGRDFFPGVDAGQIWLHVRCPPGTRIEETERYFARVEDVIRKDIPAGEITTLIDNIGIPYSGINLSLSQGTLVSAADGEIQISLKEGHKPTPGYVSKVRRDLNAAFPDFVFFFMAPDIATQVLNFGTAAPIDVQVVGPLANQPKDYEIAKRMRNAMAQLPGAVDVHLHQVVNTPELRVDVDRTLADQLGYTQRDVASDLLISLSSSGQAAPNFWLDPKRGVQYSVNVQTPQYNVASVNALSNTPIAGNGTPQLLGNIASVSRGLGATNITHYNNAGTYDVQVSVENNDLGSVSDGVNKLVEAFKKDLPRGTTVAVRGQVQSMNSSFRSLAYGLVFAVVLVYLLMVVNFQSWTDPVIILMALPGALAGIIWMLFATGTTINVPSLMGAIMSIGVATSNSILMITFANDQRHEGRNAHDAALLAGITRLRPVIMTALAMIIGMLPMSLGLGEGGEQNAPLGPAVIGGLLVATFSTLFFVPVVYSALRTKPPKSAGVSGPMVYDDPVLEEHATRRGEGLGPIEPARPPEPMPV